MLRDILMRMIIFSIFSLLCLIVLYIFISIKERRTKNYFKKKSDIISIRTEMIKLENVCIKCKITGALQGKDKVIKYLEGIEHVINASNNTQNLCFEPVPSEDAREIIKQVMTLNSEAKNLFFEYNELSDRLYKNLHPVKHCVMSIKKNVKVQILRLLVSIMKKRIENMEKNKIKEDYMPKNPQSRKVWSFAMSNENRGTYEEFPGVLAKIA